MEQTKKKNKGLVIIATICLLMSIAFIGAGVYILSSPKTIMLLDLNYFLSTTKDAIDSRSALDDFIDNNKIIKMDSNVDITLDPSLGLPNFNAELTYTEDRDNKVSYLNVNILQNKEALLALETYLTNNNIFLNIKDITNEFYSQEQEYSTIFDKIKSDDYSILLDIVAESIKENTEDKNITKEKQTIKIKNEDVKVTKISYAINEKILANYTKAIIEKISNDDEATELLMKLSSMTKEQMNKTFKSILSSLEDATDTKKLFEYNVYYKGFNKVIKSEIVCEGYSASYYRENDSKQVLLTYSDQDVINISVEKGNVTGDLFGMVTLKGTMNLENKTSFNITAALKANPSESVNVILESNLKNEKDTVSEMANLQVDIKLQNTLNFAGKYGIKVSNKYSKGTKIDTTRIKNAKSFNEIDEVTLQQIYTNLMNHKVMQLISSLSLISDLKTPMNTITM